MISEVPNLLGNAYLNSMSSVVDKLTGVVTGSLYQDRKNSLSFPSRNFDINKLLGGYKELARSNNTLQENNTLPAVHTFSKAGNFHILTINHNNAQHKYYLNPTPAKHTQFTLHKDVVMPLGDPYYFLGAWDQHGNLSLNKDQEYKYIATASSDNNAWLLAKDNFINVNDTLYTKLREYLKKHGFNMNHEFHMIRSSDLNDQNNIINRLNNNGDSSSSNNTNSNVNGNHIDMVERAYEIKHCHSHHKKHRKHRNKNIVVEVSPTGIPLNESDISNNIIPIKNNNMIYNDNNIISNKNDPLYCLVEPSCHRSKKDGKYLVSSNLQNISGQTAVDNLQNAKNNVLNTLDNQKNNIINNLQNNLKN